MIDWRVLSFVFLLLFGSFLHGFLTVFRYPWERVILLVFAIFFKWIVVRKHIIIHDIFLALLFLSLELNVSIKIEIEIFLRKIINILKFFITHRNSIWQYAFIYGMLLVRKLRIKFRVLF